MLVKYVNICYNNANNGQKATGDYYMKQETINKAIRKHLNEDTYIQVSPKSGKLQMYENFGISFWAKIWDEEQIQILVQDDEGNSEEYYMDYRTFFSKYKY